MTAKALVIPEAWLTPARMKGIIVHWTAGQHDPSDNDREHYHVLIDGAGALVRGVPTIVQNQDPIAGPYAAHTRHCNTGFIGVSLCCMALAVESRPATRSTPRSCQTLRQREQLEAGLASPPIARSDRTSP